MPFFPYVQIVFLKIPRISYLKVLIATVLPQIHNSSLILGKAEEHPIRYLTDTPQNCQGHSELKIVQHCYIPPHSVSPIVNISLKYGTFVIINEPILIHYY